ncbi:hypothetical protein PRIPAC_91523 [Pristionchus pacificus]|uniref:Uncharacterized protein n=1 Tax=Pristionchus pacificus TaxID=54126 RepID=A0A2A6B9U9_PRIPA|nr:hypothetical protein PRIPAC_91523 [Pristionchus pacificus]|eukprot:PDM62662.1 hypothetical protein PRIPAC_49877 [Pristionchus pacificus]
MNWKYIVLSLLLPSSSSSACTRTANHGEKVPTTTEPKTSFTSTTGQNGEESEWLIKSVHGTYLKVSSDAVKRVAVDSAWDASSRWIIGQRGDKTYIKAKESSLFLGAHKISTIGLDTELTDESLFVVHKNADQSCLLVVNKEENTICTQQKPNQGQPTLWYINTIIIII